MLALGRRSPVPVRDEVPRAASAAATRRAPRRCATGRCATGRCATGRCSGTWGRGERVSSRSARYGGRPCPCRLRLFPKARRRVEPGDAGGRRAGRSGSSSSARRSRCGIPWPAGGSVRRSSSEAGREPFFSSSSSRHAPELRGGRDPPSERRGAAELRRVPSRLVPGEEPEREPEEREVEEREPPVGEPPDLLELPELPERVEPPDLLEPVEPPDRLGDPPDLPFPPRASPLGRAEEARRFGGGESAGIDGV